MLHDNVGMLSSPGDLLLAKLLRTESYFELIHCEKCDSGGAFTTSTNMVASVAAINTTIAATGAIAATSTTATQNEENFF
ncbi:Hypothetical predicted protein [Octopus vulgaris]|uniref:Uncharacterized protein n=1 Tax=Octopus vulgaris TaxID=6645 RepID=A0AA36AWQ7_OCTVU|nr:Hypothetical predicted protein [Octopus vulgaris]